MPAHRRHRRSMLPWKESGADQDRYRGRCPLPRANLAARGREAGGRQPEPVPDGLLDLLPGWPGVHRDHVLLAAEDVQHGIGLRVVLAEPDGERLLGVVLAPDQLAAAGVAPALGGRAVVDQAVVHPAARAQPPGEHPARDLAVGQVEVDHPVDVVALQEELRLALVAREAVDDEAVVPVVLAEPYPHDGLDEVVADQQSRRHRALDLRAELRVMLHVPPEDIPDSDVLKVEVRGEHLRVSSLAAALDAHDDVFPHATTFARNWAAGSWPHSHAAARVTSLSATPARRRPAVQLQPPQAFT